jgi:ABC-type Fe3+-hydroxamate transport system substrate-binding protein
VSPPVDRRRFLAGLSLVALAPRRVMARTSPRVAALDWALAETMMALGHPPVGIVAASDWDRFVVEPALPAGVVDLGLYPEINVERLAALRPDLILTSPFVQTLEPVVRTIAPTLRLSIFEPGPVPLAQPRALARILGERLGRVEAAARFLADAEQRLDACRARVAALAPRPMLLVTFVDARHVRVYGGAGLYQNVLDRLGLVNAWTGATSYWGYATVGIERLATDRDVHLIVFEPVPPDARPTLERSPLWSRLPFVRAGHVSVLPSVLMFGAMPAALRFARLLVERLERLSR